MLFNSFEFLLVFFPIVLFLYHKIKKYSFNYAIWFLAFSSAVFYAYWEIYFLPILILSLVVNYRLGFSLGEGNKYKKYLLAFGLAFNLGLLCYFKYMGFFVDTINAIFNKDYNWIEFALPIGISFFTFQQIAYLVDIYNGEKIRNNFSQYSLFVCFFPQLIAGPIVHHKEMMGQFFRRKSDENSSLVFRAALTLLTVGLLKKLFLADTAAIVSTNVFNAVNLGKEVSGSDAWLGAVGYTLQIYFDFSAYSDMAIGLALFFGIHLPINFMSPYRSGSIIDFWKRWHITLSRFLRDYVYFPLGGNRKGKTGQYVNLILTMTIGGFWHGAEWTFILWGGVHGSYLLINHLYRKSSICKFVSPILFDKIHLNKVIVIFCVVVAWVPFRASNIEDTFVIWKAMFTFSDFWELSAFTLYLFGNTQIGLFVLSIVVALFLPNIYQILAFVKLGLPSQGYSETYLKYTGDKPKWFGSNTHSFVLGVMLFLAFLKLNDVSEFIYFQF